MAALAMLHTMSSDGLLIAAPQTGDARYATAYLHDFTYFHHVS